MNQANNPNNQIVPDLAGQLNEMTFREEVAGPVNYDSLVLKAPVYKYRRLQAQGSGGALTLSAASVTQSQFNIPSIPYNLSRSFITLDATNAAAGNNLLNTYHTDCVPMDSIIFKPLAGENIVQVDNAQEYTKVSQASGLTLNEYQSRAGAYADTAIGAALPISEITGCQPYSRTQQTIRTNVNLQINNPTDAYIVNAGGVSVQYSATTNASGVTTDEKELQRLVSGGTNVVTAVRYKIPLSAFVGTFLAVDKTVSFAALMNLTINWAAVSKWGFVSQVNGTTGLVALSVPTITNYWLYLAEDISESGQEIHNLASTSGLSLNIPYLDCRVFTPAAAGLPSEQDASYVIAPGNGYLVKRIITVPCVASADNTTSRAANLDNVNGVKWTSVQSFLDGKPLQDYTLSLADGSLYYQMHPLIKSSPLGISRRTWEITCFFMDNFSDCMDSTKFAANDEKDSGLEVNNSRNYAARFNYAIAAQTFIYAVYVKRLSIKPSGVNWVI